MLEIHSVPAKEAPDISQEAVCTICPGVIEAAKLSYRTCNIAINCQSMV